MKRQVISETRYWAQYDAKRSDRDTPLGSQRKLDDKLCSTWLIIMNTYETVMITDYGTHDGQA